MGKKADFNGVVESRQYQTAGEGAKGRPKGHCYYNDKDDFSIAVTNYDEEVAITANQLPF
ncbi:MAG: hypothetical protein CBD31_02590 [Flavobacteriaceae bacterium TMED171]|nr:hypothetical protein [Flavobacteriaceae bacterium]OUW31954.1 MAG: hypothetical protein CBD31_02590 [Flavobacteriaceae bacterium TMED171]